MLPRNYRFWPISNYYVPYAAGPDVIPAGINFRRNLATEGLGRKVAVQEGDEGCVLHITADSLSARVRNWA